MTGPLRLTALALALGLGATAAPADTGTDVAALEACLGPVDQQSAQPTACFDLIAGPCREGPGGETTLGIVDCMQRETAAWDVLLNRYYKGLRGELEEPARTSIRDAQRAWIAFRDADCGFAYNQFIGGSIRVVTGATCQRDRTAERAVQLRDYLYWGN